jgi:Secretion system C-terminal sorting domain
MKRILQLLVFVFITNSFAQSNSTSFDWAFNTGGRGDSADRMQYNSNGDLLVLGTITGTGQFGSTQLNGGANIRYIGKRTDNGTMTVLKSFRNYTAAFPFVIVPYDMAIDNNNNIILTGVLSYAPTPFDFGNGVTLTGKGFFMVKYDSAGVAQWAKLYDLNTSFDAYTSPIALQIMTNNDIYFLAKSPNGIQPPTWLIKLDSNGTELWHKEFNFKLITKPQNNFFVDNNGNTHILVGSFDNSIVVLGETLTKEPNASISADFCSYLLSFDANGNKKTYKPITGFSTDYAVEKESGNVIFNHSSFFANSPAQYKLWPACPLNYKGFIVTDENYNYIKSQAGTFNPNEESIYPTGNFSFFGCTTSNINGNGVGGTVASGRVITAGSQNYTVTANKSALLLKFYDTNLNFSGFVAHPELNSLTAPSDIGKSYAFRNNKIVLSGSFYKINDPTININGTTLTACNINNTNGEDVFITQVDVTSFSLSNKKQILVADFKLYPNPAINYINLLCNNNLENANIKIISVLGQTVIEKQNFSGNNLSLDVVNLANGIYVIEVIAGELKFNSKFVKQ